jgi:hypothetical protein
MRFQFRDEFHILLNRPWTVGVFWALAVTAAEELGA